MAYKNIQYCLFSIILFEIFVSGQNLSEEQEEPGYGTEWMYFPDGDDVPQRIPLNLPMSMSPSSSRRMGVFLFDDIEYRLYTRYNVNNYILLDQSAKPPNNTKYDIRQKLSNAPIKLVTHGWESSADKSAVINIKNAYLKAQDVNVIGVDWSSVADSFVYPLVAYQTAWVGSNVAKFLNALSDRYGVTGDQLHLIGHSLGAHVMGNAGHECKFKVNRITGLDPARPLFEVPSRPANVKLDASDASFVDIIHTCGGILGVEDTIGHADFFPNSGLAPQPGCSTIQHAMEACSHSRSHFYFAESILYPRAFPSYQCRTWEDYLQSKCNQHTFMGESVNQSIMGNFYLETNHAVPYGRGLNVGSR